MEFPNDLIEHITKIVFVENGRSRIEVSPTAFPDLGTENGVGFTLDETNFKALDKRLQAAGVTYEPAGKWGEFIPVYGEAVTTKITPKTQLTIQEDVSATVHLGADSLGGNRQEKIILNRRK